MNQAQGYLLHRAILFQCLHKAPARTAFCFWSTLFWAITTISSPINALLLQRKLSLTRRFILFLLTARRMRFLAIARPRRARGRLFCFARTTNCPSIERSGLANTALNWPGFLSLLAADNLCSGHATALRGKSLAPLGPACLDNKPTSFGSHPQAKAMTTLTFKFAWLVCAFHSVSACSLENPIKKPVIILTLS